MAASAVAAPLLSDVGPLCPVRWLTGIPCPGCGMRGGVTAIAHGDVVAGLAANPLAVILVLIVAAAWLSLLVRARASRHAWNRYVVAPPAWMAPRCHAGHKLGLSARPVRRALTTFINPAGGTH